MAKLKQGIFGFPALDSSINKIRVTDYAKVTSSFNTTSKGARVASAFVHAVHSLIENRDREIGIAYSSRTGEVLIEINASKSATRKVLVYDTKNKELFTGVLDKKTNELSTDEQYVSVEYISVMILVNNILFDNESKVTWEKYFPKATIPLTLTIDNSILFDAMYYCIGNNFPNFDLENEIGFVDASMAEGEFKDITKDIIGVDGKFTFAKLSSPRKQKKTSAKITLDSLREKYSSVTEEYFNSLSSDEKSLIPDKESCSDLAYFVPTDTFVRHCAYVAHAIKAKDLSGMSKFAEGPKGTGKSLSAYATAYIFNLPMRIIQGHKDFAASDIIGGPVADNGVLKTETHTEMLDTMRYGGLLLIDDLTYIPPGYTTILLGILDKPYSIKSASGELIKRHPMSFIYGTLNPDDYIGANGMNEALRSRPRIFESLHGNPLPPEKIIDMVVDATGYPDRDEVRTMYDCYKCICTFVEDDMTIECSSSPCFRNLISWATLAMVEGSNPVLAALDNIIPSLGFKNAEDEKKLFTTVILPRFKGKYSADFF